MSANVNICCGRKYMRRFMRPAYKLAHRLLKNRIWNQGNYAVYTRKG